ncbi:MAG: RNA polymerase sigma-70 factor (ECF subfamily) [Myxococcota bacterium]|jgi:RNA polymerase sigma-70 factor (ECF subfamily)
MTTAPFEHLLAAHSRRVHRAALGILGDEQEAREVAQEALLKAHRARARYDTSRPFYPWLYRIVKNTCFDARARGRHRALPGLQDERVAAPDASPGDRIDQSRAIARMRTALETLSADHREIIAMRHFQDLSYAEIGTLLGVKQGTVMSRLFRARRALSAAMEAT